MLSELSVDEKDIFTQAMPSSVNVGLEEEADDFLTLIRYSMPATAAGGARPRTPGTRPVAGYRAHPRHRFDLLLSGIRPGGG